MSDTRADPIESAGQAGAREFERAMARTIKAQRGLSEHRQYRGLRLPHRARRESRGAARIADRPAQPEEAFARFERKVIGRIVYPSSGHSH